MQDYNSDPLLALIKERNLIDDLQFEEVQQEMARTGKPSSEILSDFGLVDLDTQLQLIAESIGTEVVNLDNVEFTPELLKNIPAGTARMYQCMPVEDFGSAIRVAMANAILLVTFAEMRRREGNNSVDAATHGAAGRLRAILMTSCAMLAGMIPKKWKSYAVALKAMIEK